MLADRYKIADKKVLMIKYLADTRYSQDEIVSHNGVKLKADVSTDRLSEIDPSEYDVICVDEVQFYPDNTILIDWADRGHIVVACGLSGNFLRKPFNGMPELISAADKITPLDSVCMDCKAENGAFTALRKERVETASKAAEKEFIGGKETYVSLCRKCYVRYNSLVTTCSS